MKETTLKRLVRKPRRDSWMEVPPTEQIGATALETADLSQKPLLHGSSFVNGDKLEAEGGEGRHVSSSSSVVSSTASVPAPADRTITAIDNANIHDGDRKPARIANSNGNAKRIHLQNTIIMSILIALIVILVFNIFFLVYKPILRYLRRKFRIFSAKNQKLTQRRYRTIDRWMIQKTVQPHDSVCESIQKYSRLPNGKPALSKDGQINSPRDASKTLGSSTPSTPPPTTTLSSKSYPQICLSVTFETNSTHSCSCSSSSSSDDSDDQNVIGNTTSNETDQSAIRDNDSESDTRVGTEIVTSTTLQETSERMQTSCDPLTRIQVLRKMELMNPKSRNTTTNNSSKNESPTSSSSSPPPATQGTAGIPLKVMQQQKKDCSFCSSTGGGSDVDGDYDDTNDDANDDDLPSSECSICMEVFKVGDRISFSPFHGCQHVFHHQCVRQWLLRKTDCPCCRVVMLPVDRTTFKVGADGGRISPDVENQLAAGEHSNNANATANDATPGRRLVPWGRLFHNHFPAATRRKRKEMENAMAKQETAKFIHELAQRKCRNYFCVECGLVQLSTDLRQDIIVCPNTTHLSRHKAN